MICTGPHRDAVREYWLKAFRLGRCLSTFPPDVRRSSVERLNRGHSAVPVSERCWSAFVSICVRESVSPRHAVLSLLQILLHRYTLADTIEVGLDIGRVLLVRTDLGGSPSLRKSLLRTVGAVEPAEAHASSWEDLQTWAREAGCVPGQALFRTVLSTPDALGSDTSERTEYPDEARLRCDLVLALRSRAGNVRLEAEYDADLYKADAVEGILGQVRFLIESLDRFLELSIDALPLWSADDANSSLRLITAQTKDFAATRCMHERFEEWALKTPHAVAIVVAGEERQEVTYSELNKSANRLARYLQSKGIGPDRLVGVYLDRTPDLVVAILAILKAGAAYLPVDLCYPAERVKLILDDAEAPVIITHSQLAANLPETEAEVVCMDEPAQAWAQLSSDNPRSGVTPKNLIYSIFTSGSTGKPKGVLISHANVSRLFDATQAWFQFDERDTWTLFHSCAFDFSVWEIWGALIYGGRLVVVPYPESRSPERLYDLLSAERVTVLNQTPSAFGQLARADETKRGRKLNELRLVIFGGEALNLRSLGGWFDKYGDVKPRLVNMYGITETTVHVTYRPLTVSDLHEAPGSVIGKPILDLQLYVLDAELQPVPARVPGEVYVGGAGVARGYLKRDELTAERFIQNPFSGRTDGKLYRTGDLARRLPGGDLEYLGRADQQVKIRGFRVELGEIESVLRQAPGVREALVTAREDGDGEKFLVAYVVPAGAEVPAADELRKAIQSTLPDYMVPSAFAFLSELPLTPHGKVDRAALPAAEVRRGDLGQPFLAPRSETERAIASVYQDVLHLDVVGIDDAFFDIGGTSLKLALVHSRLQSLMGREFSIADLFVHTTIRRLAAHFNGAGDSGERWNEVRDRAQRQRQAMSAGRRR